MEKKEIEEQPHTNANDSPEETKKLAPSINNNNNLNSSSDLNKVVNSIEKLTFIENPTKEFLGETPKGEIISEDFSIKNDILGVKLPFQRLAQGVIWKNEEIMKRRAYDPSDNRVDLNDEIDSMQKNTLVLGGSTEDDYKKVIKEVYEKYKDKKELQSPQIWVENDDCIVVGQRLEQKFSERPLILNLAQRWKEHICGRCENAFYGSQEESIERRSAVYRLSLAPTLNPYKTDIFKDSEIEGDYEYHIPRFGTVVSLGVPILRDGSYQLYQNHFLVDICAAGSIDLRDHSHSKRPNERALFVDEKGDLLKEKFCSETEMRIEMVLASAVLTNHTVLVLGAFGCGAFKCPIDLVAQCFKNVLRKTIWNKGQFKAIVFANKGKTVFQGFQEIFSKNE